MRVIAGTARRIQLETVKGNNTRPTTDRIKETLFNIINNDLYDIDFLDLFSGSGAIGIEALSRGASSATFVENNRNAIKCIAVSYTHLDVYKRQDLQIYLNHHLISSKRNVLSGNSRMKMC